LVGETGNRLTDAHTEELAIRAAEGAALRPWLFVNRLSRLVVDPERLPDEGEEMRAVGMGACPTSGTRTHAARRRATV
jgi:N-formylglutamate deformylase